MFLKADERVSYFRISYTLRSTGKVTIAVSPADVGHAASTAWWCNTTLKQKNASMLS